MKLTIIFLLLSIVVFEQISQADCKIDRGSGFKEEDFKTPFPEKIEAALGRIGANGRASVISTCSSQPEYLDSMKRLERSAALAALRTPSVLEVMKQLDLELLSWITRLEELRLIAASGRKPRDSDIMPKVDEVLKDNFGDCDPFQPGCVGNNSSTIREVFKNGNIRERFYVSWNSAYRLILKNFTCSNSGCACSESISKFLSLGKLPDSSILKLCKSWKNGDKPLNRGRFGKTPEYFRRSRREFDHSVSIFHPQTMEIPLSDREIKFLSEHEDLSSNWRESLVLNTGIGNFVPLKKEEFNLQDSTFPDPHNYYYSAAERFGFPIAVSISGSTDNILNLGCVLNHSTVSDLERLRLAAIAYMIFHRHHSIFEIMTAGKSYKGLEILANSDFYKILLSEDHGFEDRVVREYEKFSPSDLRLPTDIYLACIGKSVQSK